MCPKPLAFAQICAAIWEWSITHETRITNLGDWCKNKQGKEADKFYWVSRPSDYMLTHFQLFSEVSPSPLRSTPTPVSFGMCWC